MRLKNTIQTTTFILLILLIISCGSGGGNTQNQTWDASDFLDSMANTVLPPIYTDLKNKAETLNIQAINFCSTPDITQLADIQAKWLDLSQTWINSTAVLFGPAVTDNRDLQINTSARANSIVNDILNSATPATITASYLNNFASSRAKGLHAVEFLLYDTERLIPTGPLADTNAVLTYFTTDSGASRRCEYLQAATEHLLNLFTQIELEWLLSANSFINEISNPGGTNSIYANNERVVEDIGNKLAQAVERYKNRSIGDPLNIEDSNIALPFEADNWRSQTSLEHLSAQLDGLERIYYGRDTDGNNSFGFDDQLLRLNQDAIHNAIVNSFANNRSLLAAVNNNLFDAVSNDRADVEALYNEATTLVFLIKREMTQALNIVIGFSSEDGD